MYRGFALGLVAFVLASGCWVTADLEGRSCPCGPAESGYYCGPSNVCVRGTPPVTDGGAVDGGARDAARPDDGAMMADGGSDVPDTGPPVDAAGVDAHVVPLPDSGARDSGARDSGSTGGPLFVAYNDFAWMAGQLDVRITHVTSSNTRSSALRAADPGLWPSSANLIDYETGDPTSVVLTVAGGEYRPEIHGDTPAASVGPAAETFAGAVTLDGAMSYLDAASPAGDTIPTSSGLDSANRYEIVLLADRGDYGWDRAALATISGADSFVNTSTTGLDDRGEALVRGSGGESTRYASNNPEGRVIAFGDIAPGADGQVVITLSPSPSVAGEVRGKYLNALRLTARRP